ncbi:uncharacterized protein LOC104934442 isoform X2 [Larimichthys crocea]|uniref:uncharacterized protein LOC104934442 isoform X2 n=1 Tax=Larimichthys crocea TaxID=215358 RepID=UPI000900E223|nr:uncharacterized protein LOC104934442 isoform X2 [Larimichthys crocea]
MKTAAFIIGIAFIWCKFTEKTTEAKLEDFAEAVQSECRDRYLWIHVASEEMPHFEALDGNGVHSISKQIASRCGYTISNFKMDGFTTFRASYYSCFTHNQNDEVFTFRFNVIVSDGGGGWISQPVSEVCSGLIWTHREIICEEDYMEVNVNRETSCGSQQGESGLMWQAALSQAQRMASLVWQLMILQRDGQVSSLSVSEAQRQGFSLTTTAQRVVLRSQYKQLYTELTMVDGVPMEVLQASLFFKQKLMVVMIDMSIACPVNSGSFDGTVLLWDVPWAVTPLVGEGATFKSRNLSLGVGGVLLDESTLAVRGFSLVQQGSLNQIGIPFGAEGGYRKSLVLNNMYKEMYVICLLYEQVFSLLYEDGSSLDTRHRMFKVLDTPLLCRPPFSLDKTMSDEQVFRVYLGNIPVDVLLEEVWINGKQLMSESAEWDSSVSPVVHINGSRGYELQLPFEDTIVHWMHLGQGVVQYSIDINFTLSIMPQRDSYYHHTFITAQVFNAFPPEITAQCSDGGIIFSVVRTPRGESLWEVGIDHEPLTSQLATQRGYRFHTNKLRTTLEVPVFSVGYNYEGINLSNFYGTFKLLLRNSKTLEVQTSTSKRCLFKTQDMIVCSADGSMTVVSTLTSTWPMVQPERTTLLDQTCRPNQTDGSRVLFEFKLDFCGTRAMVGESYVVYENEIVHHRQMIADGPNFISRESQFKLTVRCFYPLNGVNRLSVDRIFRSESPGFGSIKVFESIEDSANKLPAQECSHQVSGNAVNTPTNQVHQALAAGGVLPHSGVRPQPKPGPSHFITVPAGHNNLLYSSHNLQPSRNFNLSPPLPEGPTIGVNQVPLQAHSGHFVTQKQDQYIFGSSTGGHLPNNPPRYDKLPDNSDQLSNLDTTSFNSVDARGQHEDNLALGSRSYSRISDHPVVGQLQIPTLQTPDSLGDSVWHSGLTWDQPTVGQNDIIAPNWDLQSLKADLSPGMQEQTQQHGANLDLSLHGSSSGIIEIEIPGHQLKSQYDPTQSSSQPHPVLHLPAQYSPDLSGSSELLLPEKAHVPVNNKHIGLKNIISDLSVDMQGFISTEQTSTASSRVGQNLQRPESVERRNTETVQSRMQTIRIKPPSQFVSSGHQLNQERFVQQANSQISNLSQYATGPMAVGNDGTHWLFQQPPEHRGSNARQEYVSDRTGFSTLKQKQGAKSEHQQKLVQSVTETGNQGGQETESSQRNVLQPKGRSLVRVRPVPGLQGRLKTCDKLKLQNLQKPTTQSETRGGTSKMPFPPQSILRDRQLNNPNCDEDHKTTAEGPGFPGSHTGPNGADDPNSDLNIHTSSDCSSHYGASVHQGIMRSIS